MELVIVMLIASLVLAMAAGLVRDAFKNEELQNAGRKLALFAKTARRQAMQENREYEIILRADSILLQPAQLEDAVAGAQPPEDSDASTGKTLEYRFPEGVKFRVKLWGADEWDDLKEQRIWTFPPTGLCAPHRFRFEKGEAWLEETFNPLTANKQDESFYLP